MDTLQQVAELSIQPGGDKWRAVVEGQDSQEPDLIVSWTA
jgi:hypothetical protein